MGKKFDALNDTLARFVLRQPVFFVATAPSGDSGHVNVHLDEVRTSCGYGVPLMDHTGDRDDLKRWAARKGPHGIRECWVDKNSESLDGLPGLPPAGE